MLRNQISLRIGSEFRDCENCLNWFARSGWVDIREIGWGSIPNHTIDRSENVQIASGVTMMPAFALALSIGLALPATFAELVLALKAPRVFILNQVVDGGRRLAAYSCNTIKTGQHPKNQVCR